MEEKRSLFLSQLDKIRGGFSGRRKSELIHEQLIQEADSGVFLEEDVDDYFTTDEDDEGLVEDVLGRGWSPFLLDNVTELYITLYFRRRI